MPLTLSRLGVTNGTTDGSWAQDNELFQDVLTGEIMTAFELNTKFDALQQVRNISEGDSAKFLAMGKALASYHIVGTSLDGQVIKQAEVDIKVDEALTAAVGLANIDTLKSTYELSSAYSAELGKALAKAYDNRIARIHVLAARKAATITGEPDGLIHYDASMLTDAAAVAKGIFEAAERMDDNSVPEEDRYFATSPKYYYMLAQKTDLINKLYGGEGVYSDGTILRVGGFTIVKSANFPKTNIASATNGEHNDYTGDFTNTVGVAFHPSAAGTVKLLNVTTESEYSVKDQETLMVAKMIVGHGILRTDASIELRGTVAP